MTKLGLCGRCFDGRPAVTIERITFGSSTYDLALCDRHADLLRRDLYGWTRCGTLVEDGTFRTRKAPQGDGDTRRGVVEVAHIHIPVARIEAVPEAPSPAPPPRPARPPAESLLPTGHDEWRFSEHALERHTSRGIGRDEALWCAIAPDIATPGTSPGTLVHIRGRVKIVLNPDLRVIITVINRSITLEQELAHAAS